MAAVVAILALALYGSLASPVQAHDGPAGAFFFESFAKGWQDRWQYSRVKKYAGRFNTVQPEGFQDTAIQLPEGNVHYGVSTVLPKTILPSEGLVVQYEVKFSDGHTCGGAYLKLLSQTDDPYKPKRLNSKTPFTIMFGPDRCGPDARVHVIINARHPMTQQLTEHHLLSAPEPRADKLSHVYTLLLHSNNRFKVLIDGVEEVSGPLAAAEWGPALQPPETISDPQHVKPDDWVEEQMIVDPSAVKPANWDDRRYITDPHAVKPEGWLDDEPTEVPDPTATKPITWDDWKDGVWVPPPVPNPVCVGAVGCGPWKAPTVPNPRYKGPWLPPQIKNPQYKGPWVQRTIPNPDYYKLELPLELLAPITAVAFELWTTDSGYIFDSILLGVGDSGVEAAAAYMRQIWKHRHKVEYAAALAAAQASSRPPGIRYWAANMLLDLLDSQWFLQLQPQLQLLAATVQQYPEVAWAVLVSPLMLLLGLAARVSSNYFKVAPAAAGDALQDTEVDEQADKAWLEQLRQQRQAAKVAAAAAAAVNGSPTSAQHHDSDSEDAIRSKKGESPK